MRYEPAEHVWVTDDMPSLRRDFLPAELDGLMAESGVSGCIAVQARQLPIENGWLLELAASWPAIRAIVGWIDLECNRPQHPTGRARGSAPDKRISARRNRRTRRLPGPAGSPIRDHRTGSPRLSLRAARAAASARPVSRDCARPAEPAVRARSRRASPTSDPAPSPEWAKGLRTLAECPNVNVKLSGLTFALAGTSGPRPICGPTSMSSWNCSGRTGSCWPRTGRSALSSTYADSVAAIVNFAAELSAPERDAILTDTARRTYNC